MKKFTLLFLMLTASAGVLRSMPDPHDSLIFDGENKISESLLINTDDDCEVRVIYVSGKPEGVIKKKKVFETCGVADTITVYENGVLERNTVVKEGESVKTGPNSTAKLLLPDGSFIFVNQNSEFLLSNDICNEIKETQGFLKGVLKIGSIWTKVKKLLGGSKFEVSTERACACVRGTEFTLEVKEEQGQKIEILKVYESTVDFELRAPDYSNVESNAEVMQKAADDYQNGKITMEEFMKITQEYAEKVTDETKDIKMKIEVNAGMMSTLKGNIFSDPAPFNTGEDRWFDVDIEN